MCAIMGDPKQRRSPMVQKHTKPCPHAEFCHRSQIPMPAVEEVEQRLTDLLSPSLLAPRQLERGDPRQPQRLIRMRQRLLTRAVMVAILVSCVWRRLPAVAEVQRGLAREGLLGVVPMPVSSQAIIRRLDAGSAAYKDARLAGARRVGPGGQNSQEKQENQIVVSMIRFIMVLSDLMEILK